MKSRNFTEGNDCMGSRNKATTLDCPKALSTRHTQKGMSQCIEVPNFQVQVCLLTLSMLFNFTLSKKQLLNNTLSLLAKNNLES